MAKATISEKIRILNQLSDKLCLIEFQGIESLSVTSVEAMVHEFSEAFKDLSIHENAKQSVKIRQMYTRFASLLSCWLAKESANISLELLLFIALQKTAINNILNNSGFSGKEHLLSMLAAEIVGSEKSFSNGGLILSLALSSLDEVTSEMLDVAISLSDEIKVPLFLGWLNQTSTFTEQGEKNRALLISSSAFLAEVKPNFRMIQCFINAWMLCSYAVYPSKHLLKKYLNQMVRHYLQAEGVQEKSVIYQLKERPKMLVIHERFIPGHAMHRCYAPYIEKLADYFDVVFLGEKEHISNSYKMAAKTILIEKNSEDIRSIVELVGLEQPDIIFYPSLGMSHFTICLANLRLAPLQIMAPGHPSSSFSNCMDYIFLFNPDEGTPALVSERIMTISDIQFKQEKHPAYSDKAPCRTYPVKGKFKVAINATSMKINGDFVSACKSIKNKSLRNVEFNFFPAVSGGDYDSFVNLINEALPGSKVHLPMDYKYFLNELSSCHLSLAPFPFGNSNSTVDALLLDMPIVAMSSSELAGRTDKHVLEQVELVAISVVENVEKYISRSLDLIDNPNSYNDFCNNITASHPVKHLLRDDQSEDSVSYSDFSRLFALIFDYHTQIQSGNAKVIDYKNISGARLYRDSLAGGAA